MLDIHCPPAQDGPTVRFVSALAAPVFPLVALLCCLLAELVKPGLGITAALQADFLWPSALLVHVTPAGAHAVLRGRGLEHIHLAELSTKGWPGRGLEALGGMFQGT